MWLLESAKDRILEVDTPRKHVPPRVRYGMTCLLIRDTTCFVFCSVEWGLASYVVKYLNCTVQEGLLWESLALQAGPLMRKMYESMAYSCSGPL
jgi:hypothetical protein